MFNFSVSQFTPRLIFCTPASPGHASVIGRAPAGSSKYSSVMFITYNVASFWNMKAQAQSLFGDSNAHFLGQEKSNALHGSNQVLNIHYLGQINNLGQYMSDISQIYHSENYIEKINPVYC